MCCFVLHYSAAFLTSVNDYVSAFWIRLGFDRTQNTSAFVGSISGVDIDMQRAKAERTVVPGCVSQRENLFTAILANKSVVVFSKSFIFHISPFSVLFPRLSGKITKMLSEGAMKKVFGILMVACICIALGLSVRWGRECDVSLVGDRAVFLLPICVL